MSTKRKASELDVERVDVKKVKKAKKVPLSDEAETSDDGETSDEVPKTNESNKLPDEILKQFQNKPGKLLIAGNVAWNMTSRKGPKNELYVFNRFTDQKYRAIFSGPTSAHSILINEDYKAFSFGRNESDQCGHKDLKAISKPKLIEGLKHLNIIQAACGHNHTLFLTDTGTVYACGNCAQGQLGIRKKSSQTIVSSPTLINYNGPPICKIGCGGDFSVILDIKGNLYTFGHPDLGQLGNNTDGKFFNDRNKLVHSIVYAPERVRVYIEKDKKGAVTVVPNVKIVDFACGKNHTIAIDSEKRAFSFGFGGYGALGHIETRNEWMPRLVKYLNMTVTGGAARVFCGSTFSLAIGGHNNLYIFGKNSKREGQMYPIVVNDLCGFNLKTISCSVTSVMLVCDDRKLIAWGASPTYGELGIGSEPKSSAKPTFVDAMDGLCVTNVAMGMEHTLLIVEDDASNEKYSSLPEYAPAADNNSK